MFPAKTLIAGDTRPTRLVYEVDGAAVDITGYQFKLRIGYPDGTLEKAGSIVDAATGKFEIPWSAAQGETPADLRGDGTYSAEMVVTDPAGKEKTHKIPGGIRIEPRLP